MTDIGNNHSAIGIKKFMVFYIGGYVKSAPAAIALDQETSCTAANRNLFYRFVQ